MDKNLLDRIPRYLSLLGLLGLLGIIGIFAPQWWRLSSLSFLSYLCYFRFFRWMVKPQPEVKRPVLVVWLLGFLAAIVSMIFTPQMFGAAPFFGLIGFAGYLGLYEPASGAEEKPAS